ncbi:MAG: PilZ domain-containing protein, partial [Candidatus Saccharicenans sp.]|nr:PilZ domain-containing protein [Candidatus Saccharicenans sp.]
MTEKNKTKARKKKSVSARKTATPVAVNRRREWRFELPLPAEIAGQLPQGKQFRKKTILENISSTGAYFTI